MTERMPLEELLMSSVVKGGNLQTVKALLTPDSVKYQDNRGRTALMNAIIGASIGRERNETKVDHDVVSYLARESHTDALLLQDENGCTALMLAAERFNVEIVKILAARNSKAIMMQDKNGATALMIGIENFDIAYCLVAAYQDVVKMKDNWNRTALHWCSSNKTPEVAQLLISCWPAGLNAQDVNGHTPLMAAFADAHNEESRSVAGFLVSKCNEDVMKVRDRYDRTALMLACWTCGLTVVESVLERWREAIELRDDSGRSVFMYAVENCTNEALAVSKFILETCPASLSSVDNEGATPLMAAASACNADVVKLIIQIKHQDTMAKDKSGKTALMHVSEHAELARINEATEVAAFLIENWPKSLAEQDTNGNTSLMLYIIEQSGRHFGFAKLLVGENGNDVVRKQNKNGQNALNLASKSVSASPDLVSWLIEMSN